MTSKTDSEQPSGKPVPSSPPKSAKRDYSSLPQRPIKLKKDVDLPDALKQETVKPKNKSTAKRKVKKAERIPLPKKKAKREPKHLEKQAGTDWTLMDLSVEAKGVAEQAANQAGVSLKEWLENLILQASETPQKGSKPKSTEEHLSASLDAIKQRLVQLERQKGFWARFWDQFMEQSKKQD